MPNRTSLLRMCLFLASSIAFLGLLVALHHVCVLPVRAEGPVGQALSSNLDDELIFVRDNKLLIYDPYPLNGTTVSWSKTYTMPLRDVATGDFNGDGDDEIVAINIDDSSPYVRAFTVFDPVVGPLPEFKLHRQETVAKELRWWRVATGDVNNDGKDEIILVTYPKPSSGYSSSFFVYDQTGGQICQGGVSGGYVNGLTVVQMKNDGSPPQIVLSTSRSEGEPDNVYVHWRNGQTCANLGSNKREGYGFDIAGGDLDGDGREEVTLAASPRDFEHDVNRYKSLAIWKQPGAAPLDTSGWWVFSWPGWGWGFYLTLSSDSYSPPYWNFIVAADLNGTGDKEIATIRNTKKWDSGSNNHLRVLDPYQKGIDSINKAYQTAVFDGIAAGDFAGVRRSWVALLSPSLPGVYLYDLGNKPKGGLGVADDGQTVAPKKTYRITAWNNERAKIMTAGDFDGGWLTSSARSASLVFLQDGTPFIDQTQIELVYPGGAATKVYTATESPAVDWLTVTPSAGTLPATMTFTASLTGVTALYDVGVYTTTVILEATDGSGTRLRGSPIVVDVSLKIIDHLESLFLPVVRKNN